MNRSAGKVFREGLLWSIFGVLFSAVFVPVVARLVSVQSKSAVYRKSLTLEMSWKRGDDHYGPNFIHLESPCLSSPESGCFCSLDFKTTTSKEFAEYVASFADNRVPVKFHVDYDRNQQVVGALLEGVGAWPEERFQINERSLATGFRMLRNQRTSGGGHVNNPADCFPKPVK